VTRALAETPDLKVGPTNCDLPHRRVLHERVGVVDRGHRWQQRRWRTCASITKLSFRSISRTITELSVSCRHTAAR